ncbi:MAG TPA: LamG domain-containing protein [Sedimentisphaerales bacterium]|nr:LamG domain-containing protein [Sedimentisphaerales bacterium]
MCKKLFLFTSIILALSLVSTNVVFGGNVIERRISAGSDDGEEAVNTGFQDSYNTSSDLEIIDDHTDNGGRQFIGMNFRDIGIAPGEKISSAYIEFVCDETKDGTADAYFLIWGHLNPNPDGFETPFVISDRPKTGAKVEWEPEPWSSVGQKIQTSNIASIIQELIDQEGWAAGNAVEIIIGEDPSKPEFTGVRCAEAYDGDQSNAPLLRIEIAVPYATEPTPVDGALLEDVWVSLGWAPGMSAVSHDVYFGDNFADVESGAESAFQGNQATTMFIAGFAGFPFPDGLVPGTTYYWRIDEVEADGTVVTGEVWSFLVPAKAAYNPIPADGGKYVDQDVELSWTEGYGAKLHTVYFGDNFDDVSNAAGGLPQAATTYTPGTLEMGKTYYWRVDEFDVVETHKGDVWSFNTIPVIEIVDPNLVGWWKFDEGSGNSALDFSGHGNNGKLGGDPQWVEGVIGGALKLTGGGHVIIDSVRDDITSTNISLSIWIKTTQANEGEIFAANSGGDHPFMFGIQGGNPYVNEGSDVGQYPPPVNDNQWHMLTYVRSGSSGYIYVDGVLRNRYSASFILDGVTQWSIGQEWDPPTPSDFFQGTVDDVRFYDASLTAEQVKELMRGDLLLAWNPSPDNNSTVDIDEAKQPLSWSAGDAASEHDVYFGADETAVDKAAASDTTGIYRGRQGATSYNIPEALEWGGGPYYWRIDEYNTDGTISTGGTWSFSVADYLIVEDFEDYDTGDNQIWYAWKDGLGYGIPGTPPYSAGNGTGSAVGDETTYSYTEETIVHGGNQAMPVYYDNNQQAKLKYSEVEMTLSSRRDWTKEGVGVLTIWFHGIASNSAESLYVALNGNAVVTHDNPNAAQVETWTQWNIDLQAFADQGVNLANVNTIAIGLGNKNNPLAGGSGTMYIDDILLYRPAP